MAKFETIYDKIGPELEELARLNEGKITRAFFEQLVAENFGCSKRTMQSYTQIFRTFGVIRPVNQNWYSFKRYVPRGIGELEDETEALDKAVRT
ncbi:MAG: hypothetical protein LUQ09_05055 [Methanomassiliicoccales archaeon]|nr:hypothetical protein [Methanomassiliicoccales archaeon]